MTRAQLLRSPWTWTPVCSALLLIGAVAGAGLNRSLFLWMNHAGSILPAAFWVNLTIVGDGAVALALVLLTSGRTPERMWAALIAALLATLWVHGWKQMISVPRPAAVFDAGSFMQIGPAWRYRSFPSGHATAVFALAGVVILGATGSRWLRRLLFVAACLVAASRIMVGVHWPLDVLAGALGGWLSACAGVLAAARASCRRWGRAALVFQGLLALIAAGLLFSTHTLYPDALVFQRLIALACLAWTARRFLVLFRAGDMPFGAGRRRHEMP